MAADTVDLLGVPLPFFPGLMVTGSVERGVNTDDPLFSVVSRAMPLHEDRIDDQTVDLGFFIDCGICSSTPARLMLIAYLKTWPGGEPREK